MSNSLPKLHLYRRIEARANARWSLDFVHDQFACGRRFRMLNVVDSLPPAVREAFADIRARVAGLEAYTERQDYLIAELHHALYGKRSEQLAPDERQLAFEYLETADAEAEAARDALV